jgi:hypothetical protein
VLEVKRRRCSGRALCTLLGAGLAAALGVHAPAARAQTADAAAALTLFEEGKQLAASGNYREGCPKLLASYVVVQKLGTLLNLADCYERSGKTASAWVRFTEAATIAERAGQQERADFARTHAAALAPRLSRLIVTVAAPPPEGLEVRRDGTTIDAAVFGTAVPVDPGTHLLEARAPHKKTWTTSIDVEPDAASPRAVAIPSLEPDDVPIAAAAPSYGPPAPAGASAVESTPEARGGAQRTWAFILGGVGGAGLVASLVSGLVAKSQYARSNDPGGCAGDVCTQPGLDDRASASTTAAVSTGIFVGGALLLATGVVLYLTSPSPSPSGAGAARDSLSPSFPQATAPGSRAPSSFVGTPPH